MYRKQSVVDVCEVLTGTENPRRYWSDLKRKLKSAGSELYEKIVQLKEKTIDPERAIGRALETYQKKGYSDEWIHQRLPTIRVRNALTEEWDNRGVRKGIEYAILTDEISKAWSGMSTRQHKRLKSLKKENLRDNMSDLELVLNMLAEATTTELYKTQEPKNFKENVQIAQKGGKVAGDARRSIESETGTPVITAKNAAELNRVVAELIEGVAEDKEE